MILAPPNSFWILFSWPRRDGAGMDTVYTLAVAVAERDQCWPFRWPVVSIIRTSVLSAVHAAPTNLRFTTDFYDDACCASMARYALQWEQYVIRVSSCTQWKAHAPTLRGGRRGSPSGAGSAGWGKGFRFSRAEAACAAGRSGLPRCAVGIMPGPCRPPELPWQRGWARETRGAGEQSSWPPLSAARAPGTPLLGASFSFAQSRSRPSSKRSGKRERKQHGFQYVYHYEPT
jgi:hypothetical protein